MLQIHKYPFIRLIILWIAGVFCGDCLFDSHWQLSWGILAFALLFVLAVAFYIQKRYSQRWCFGVAALALCFAGGWIGVTRQLQQATGYTFPKAETVYRALLTDAPEAKKNTLLCRVLLTEQCDSAGAARPVGCNVLLYLAKDSAALQLESGDELLAFVCITPPANNRNFDEFDYARYLMRQGIAGTGYVATGKWTLLSSPPLSPASGASGVNAGVKAFCYNLKHTARLYREKLIALYRRLGLEGDGLALLSALTTGDRTELSISVRESFSVAGASHILALSGLHIGLLYAVLFFALKPVARQSERSRKVCAVLLIACLWAFAFFTGCSPSVVRSVTMFSLWTLAGMFGRQPFSFNTLAVTAWLMLLYNPVWLFDVGFQLSFVAVASILLVQPSVYRLLAVKSRLGKYVWGLMSVSIAAQLGTAPLVMFYFSRFSTHFLLTNLVVVPLVTVILYAALLMLCLTPFAWIQAWVAEGVRRLLEVLNLFVRWVEQLPYSSVDGIWLYPWEVFGIYIALLLYLYYIRSRRYKRLITCLSFLLLLCVCHAVASWADRPRTGLAFYNIRGCPAVHCIESDGRSWINYADTLPDKELLKRRAGNYWRRHRLLPPEEVTADCEKGNFLRHKQFLFYHGCCVCMVTDNRWRYRSADSARYPVDYLYLCKGFGGRLEELTKFFRPRCVILDASLSERRRKSLEDECRQSGLHFISLAEEGAVFFSL